MKMTQLSAFILGATGETGKELLLALAANQSISKLVLIGRRKQDLEQDTFKNVEQRVIDFDKIGEFSDSFQGFDVGYCCLGTTKGKAGKEGFFKVDHDYVVESAKLAKEGGCKHFHLVTAQGANKNSWFLYPKTKGQAEAAVEDLGFDRLSIYRPALLLCDRQVIWSLFWFFSKEMVQSMRFIYCRKDVLLKRLDKRLLVSLTSGRWCLSPLNLLHKQWWTTLSQWKKKVSKSSKTPVLSSYRRMMHRIFYPWNFFVLHQ